MPTQPKKKSFLEILQIIPNAGDDADFERVQDAKEPPPEYTTKTLSLEDMDAAIEGFQSAELSLGQLSKTLNKSQRETIQLLTSLDIPVIDYDLAEDLEAIEYILKDKS